mmetsp:Transcript_72852/g.183600  ORF Transcript_72852/g.183600 Transcript_72852/m.183600 type:complete len:551 (+) Transcript_72852:66-1718(+)
MPPMAAIVAVQQRLKRLRPILVPMALAVLLRLLRRKPHRKLPLACDFVTMLRRYFARTSLQLHHEFAQKVNKGCWTIKVPHDPRIFATVNPEVVDHILISKFTNYDKGPQWRTAFKDLLGHGIFNADGSMWKMQRKVASHEFSVRSLRDFMFKVFQAHSEKAVRLVGRACSSGAVVNAQDLFARYTLDSIGQIGFGIEIGCLEDSELGGKKAEEFSNAFDTATQLSADRFVDPLWNLKRLLNIGSERRLRQAIHGVHAFSDRIIAERRAASCEDLASRHDILSRYMRHTSEGRAHDTGAKSREFSFTNENLRDVVINFVLAGRDTTANLLTWSIFELAQNPAVVEELRREAQRVRAAGSDSVNSSGLAFESFSKMPYLQATLTEVLRLHPSVPLDFKTANEDDILPDGTQVYRGERVMFVTWSMGRQPDLWPNPESFDPMRHIAKPARSESDSTTDSSGDSDASPRSQPAGLRFRYPPVSQFPVFHAGPRTCLGKDSAYLGAGIVLTALLDRFDFRLVKPPEEVEHETGLTLWIRGGLDVMVVPREAPAA